MKLARLEVTRLPGFSSSFCLQDLAGDVNLITGPNAIGKSSLVRALKLLLGESAKTDPLVTLAAEFVEENKTWRVDRTGQQFGWTCDGKAAQRPNLPAADQLGRYCLSMEDLIKADSTDASLAQELQRELCGGFDLDAVRTNIGARHGTGERRELDSSLDGLRDAERTSDILRKDQQAIPSLTAEIEQAHKAEEQVRLIDQAKGLLKAMRASKAAKEQLAEFPSNMDKITGQELADIKKHRSALEKSEAERLAQEQALRLAQISLEDSGLAASDIEQAATDLATIERNLRKVEKLQPEQAQQLRTLAQQKDKFEDASQQLGSDTPTNLNLENLRQAEGFAAEFLKLTETRNQLEQLIELSGGVPDEGKFDDHLSAVNALQKWLDPQMEESHKRRFTLLLSSSLVLAIASIVGFIFLPPLLPALFALLLLSALVWALVTIRSSSSRAAKTRARDAVKQFDESGIPTPEEWSFPAVRKRLRELEDALSNLKHASQAQAKLTALGEKIQTKEQEKLALSETIGFDPLIPLTSLDRFIRLSKDWDESRLALESTNRALADTSEEIQKEMGKTRSVLSRWVSDVSEDTDFDQLSAACTNFQERLKEAQKASDEIKIAAQLVKKQLAESSRHRDEIAAIYQKVGLVEEDHHLLVDRVGRLESWKDAGKDLIGAEAQERQSKSALEGREVLLELVDSGDEPGLDALLDKARQCASQLESLREERARIEAEIGRAEQDDALEKANAERVEAVVNLEQKRDDLLAHEATELLLGQVEDEFRSTHEPKVLSDANALFQQVTANAFELELGDGGGFRARDTQQGEVRKLDELSTGTRMQLLLAVRVAWVQSQGADGRMLPVFLDEAFTTSDEARFMVLVKSLDQISESVGLQVIYLSARRHEQDLWRTALGREPHCVDLATLRGKGDTERPPDFEIEPPQPVPQPGKSNAIQYAKALGVPFINPMLDAGEIHLFHILRDDLQIMYRFLDSLRIASLGQLESYLGRRDGEQADTHLPHLIERCRTARAWALAWREGRGRVIGALELEESEAFSRIFLSQAARLAASEDVSGDAEKMLKSLRDGKLKGFRSKNIEDFEAWLKEHEYLDDRPVLSRDERRQRVLQAYELDDEERLEDIGQCVDWLEAAVTEIDGAAE